MIVAFLSKRWTFMGVTIISILPTFLILHNLDKSFRFQAQNMDMWNIEESNCGYTSILMHEILFLFWTELSIFQISRHRSSAYGVRPLELGPEVRLRGSAYGVWFLELGSDVRPTDFGLKTLKLRVRAIFFNNKLF